MDDILRKKIADKLRNYLNREPSESEIINGQNDTILMGWLRDDDHQALQASVQQLSSLNKIN